MFNSRLHFASAARDLVALLCVLFVFGCGGRGSVPSPEGNTELKRFRVAIIVWVGYAPIHLALEKGFFADHGVDVQLQKIEDTAARRAALSSGAVDGSVDIVDSFANAVAAGLPAKAVLKIDDSMGGDGIVVTKEVQSIEDLAGKTVAYPPGQPSHFFLLALLDEAGMSIDELESKLMEADQAGAAFVSQSVDAAVTWEPWLSRSASLPHGRILTTSREKPGLIVDILTVRTRYLEENPDAVEAFIRGWLDAVEYWRQNPVEANAIMAEALGLPIEDFVKIIDGVRYTDLEANREFFIVDEGGASPFRDLMARAAEIWLREGLVSTPIDPEQADGSQIVLDLAP